MVRGFFKIVLGLAFIASHVAHAQDPTEEALSKEYQDKYKAFLMGKGPYPADVVKKQSDYFNQKTAESNSVQVEISNADSNPTPRFAPYTPSTPYTPGEIVIPVRARGSVNSNAATKKSVSPKK